jgi:hypothetical protein
MDFAAAIGFAFEEVDDCISDVAAKALEGVPFNVKAGDVGMVDIPDAGIIIMGVFDDCDAHVLCSLDAKA